MSEQLIGKVTHYYSRAHVAAVQVTGGELHVGDTVHVVGHTSDFIQPVDSIEVEHRPVPLARSGESIGIHVIDHAREHDKVFRVMAD